jgi:hypothetical protein
MSAAKKNLVTGKDNEQGRIFVYSLLNTRIFARTMWRICGLKHTQTPSRRSTVPHRSPLWCRLWQLNQHSKSRMLAKMTLRNCSHSLSWTLVCGLSWTLVDAFREPTPPGVLRDGPADAPCSCSTPCIISLLTWWYNFEATPVLKATFSIRCPAFLEV